MQTKLVVLGGSAGSLNTFISVLRDLDKNFPAAVIVILHLRARVHSSLDQILARSSALPVSNVEDGITMECGKVYVAVPDRHIVVGRHHLHLSRGPKEGLNRPSINVAFRSAAAVYGPEVVGVLLSGMLDDGAAGLLEIVKAWRCCHGAGSRRCGISFHADRSLTKHADSLLSPGEGNGHETDQACWRKRISKTSYWTPGGEFLA